MTPKAKISKAIELLKNAVKEDEVYDGRGDYDYIMKQIHETLEVLK